MDKDIAWQDFEDTGKIESYLKYKEMCNNIVKGEYISESFQGEGDSDKGSTI